MNGAYSASRLRVIGGIVFIAVLALGSFWLREVMTKPEAPADRAINGNEADYSVENFNFVRLSETGEVRYNISGAKLTHFANDTAEIDMPVVHASSAQSLPLTMRAERAIVTDNSKKIHLYRQVRLDRPGAGRIEPLHITSEYLLALPDDDVVQTDKAVDIQSGHSHLSGVGMYANNATRELRLASRVQASLPAKSASPMQ